MAISHVWRSPDGQRYVIAAKGAPEAVMDLCHLPAEKKAVVQARVEELSAEGLRLLGVARADFRMGELPRDQHDFDFQFLGLLGLEDPLRPLVKESVAECHEAGVRVLIITGDHPGTALRVAERAGIVHEGKAITGPELEAMGEDELHRRVGSINVFSRMVPEQKLFLVRALQERGEVVAMGGRGADVARESADLVLLGDDFPSLVWAVRSGRRIYENLKKAFSYIIAVHVPIAGMTILPIFFRLPLVLSPIHIAFLEILIDPSCSLVFEAEPREEGLMRRPPRPRTERLFSRRNLAFGFLQGLTALAVVFVVFLLAYLRGMEEKEVRALTFSSLVVTNVALLLANRSWEKMVWQLRGSNNPVARWIVPGALFLLALVLYVPPLRRLFDFAPLHHVDPAICLGASVASVAWFEAFKAARPWRAVLGKGAASWEWAASGERTARPGSLR
ncbi:MAG: cation transporting ATPase C-terminal domain-containing protein [Actinomycetota bacterium]